MMVIAIRRRNEVIIRDWKFPYFMLIAEVFVLDASIVILTIDYNTFITELSIIVLFHKPDSWKNQLIGLLSLIVPKGKIL